mgnify:CR=1 FL=1
MSERTTGGTQEGRDTGLLESVLSFPNPVNEVAARLVAAMVVGLSVAILVTGYQWLFFVLAYGFLARAATGPTLSPMGLLATRVLVPLLGSPNRPVPGPPKRFAQTVGLVFSGTALVLSLAIDSAVPAKAVIGVLAVFATLESAAGFCAGCFVFGYLMRWNLIPESVCRECVMAEQLAATARGKNRRTDEGHKTR